jgi:hypothetical protein
VLLLGVLCAQSQHGYQLNEFIEFNLGQDPTACDDQKCWARAPGMLSDLGVPIWSARLAGRVRFGMARASRKTGTRAVRSLAAWLLERELTTLMIPMLPWRPLNGRVRSSVHGSRSWLPRLACQSLLARAIHVAAAEAPFLRGVRAGTILGRASRMFVTVPAGRPASRRGRLLAGVAHLIGLLAVFIGEGRTERLVRDVCPDAHSAQSGA